ncbi:MAG: glycosyltransferase family 4 protein [bacterium]|nr:glycosyltransferase family 4 protein [bacterium]
MKIAINARVLNERYGGPARYTLNLIKELSRIDTTNEYFILMYDNFTFDFDLPKNFNIIVSRFKSRILFDYLYLPVFTRRNKIDLSIYPKNTFSPLNRGKKIPIFNDIVYFEKLGFREFKFFDNLHHTIMIPISGKFSYMNLSISEFTAARMEELLGIKREKIKIMDLAVEEKFKKIDDRSLLDPVIKKYDLKQPFFFYAGSLSPRKNMMNMLRAFEMIKDKMDHTIYVTGGYSWRDDEIFTFINEHGLQNRIIKLGFLDENELVALYNLADCYLYPSLYEGFGLPILEAQACGCPVITSTAASCPEVAGKGALLVDPNNIEEIAQSMQKIVRDKKLRNSTIKAGFQNLDRYSWDRTAKELIKFFDDCSNNLY